MRIELTGHTWPRDCSVWCSPHQCPTVPMGGVFAQRAHSAGTARAQCAHSANYYGDYPGNSPENHPPAESCTTNSNLKNSNI